MQTHFLFDLMQGDPEYQKILKELEKPGDWFLPESLQEEPALQTP